MNAIVPVTSTTMPFGELERLADAIAKSGMFGMKTKDQALVLMAISQAEGRHPALAARDYDVIQGRPSKKAEAMMRDFLQAGGKIEWHALTDECADATFSHPQTGRVRIAWDMKRATVAGLAAKDMFKKFPRQMLRSRTVSEGIRTLWPLATSGFYVPEEAADIEQFTGDTIDHDPTPVEQPPEPPRPASPASTPRPPRVAEKPAQNGNGHRTDEQWRAWLDKLRSAVNVVYNRDEVVEIGGRETVGDALAKGPQWVQREISTILAEGYGRFSEPETPADQELAPVEIEGERYLGAG